MGETMIAIYMICSALATTALANGPFECSFMGSAEIHQCFGSVGQPLIFYLSNKTNVAIRLLKDGKHRILKTDRNGRVTVDEEYANDSEMVHNGAYKIISASKRHAGEYELEEYDSHGQILNKVHLHLKIQAPVSKPAISQTCLSQERMEITCSAEGDEAEFSLTLDDQLFIQIRDHGQSQINCTAKKCVASSVSINLHGQLAGHLMCRVQNNVSKDETRIHLAPCTGFDAVKVAVIASIAILSFFVALSLFLNKLCKKSRPTTVDEDNCDGGIIYTDVKVMKRQGTQDTT